MWCVTSNLPIIHFLNSLYICVVAADAIHSHTCLVLTDLDMHAFELFRTMHVSLGCYSDYVVFQILLSKVYYRFGRQMLCVSVMMLNISYYVLKYP